MAEDDRTAERQQMVEDIVALSRLVAGDGGPADIGARVLTAMGKVPRHEFVPVLQRRAAYRNRPLSIGSGQTISQPYIVALMTDLLDLQPGDKVLEIGTGCGYQAAVLAELAKDIYTIEIVEALGRTAAATLARRPRFSHCRPKRAPTQITFPASRFCFLSSALTSSMSC
jgi:protein-L-isoaspartate(D-aspartate) O-methyltransferase